MLLKVDLVARLAVLVALIVLWIVFVKQSQQDLQIWLPDPFPDRALPYARRICGAKDLYMENPTTRNVGDRSNMTMYKNPTRATFHHLQFTLIILIAISMYATSLMSLAAGATCMGLNQMMASSNNSDSETQDKKKIENVDKAILKSFTLAPMYILLEVIFAIFMIVIGSKVIAEAGIIALPTDIVGNKFFCEFDLTRMGTLQRYVLECIPWSAHELAPLAQASGVLATLLGYFGLIKLILHTFLYSAYVHSKHLGSILAKNGIIGSPNELGVAFVFSDIYMAALLK